MDIAAKRVTHAFGPGEHGPRRVSCKEIEDAFVQGWPGESIEPTRFEVRPDLMDI